LVVVYTGASAAAAAHPDRLRARQTANGHVVYADTASGRDVLRVPGGDAGASAERVRQLPGVLDAYPDRAVALAGVADDPLLDEQWNLTRIQAQAAWDVSQGSGVRVAILDCGIHASHPDLIGKVVVETNFSASS